MVYHMFNEESRKYFNRAFAMSGPAFHNITLTRGNHIDRMRECSKFNDTDEIIEYLRTTDSKELTKCYFRKDWGKTNLSTEWAPTIENANANKAFFTQTPEEMFESDEAPVLDTLFSFTSQVFRCSAECLHGL